MGEGNSSQPDVPIKYRVETNRNGKSKKKLHGVQVLWG